MVYEIIAIVLGSLLGCFLLFVLALSIALTRILTHPHRYSRKEQTAYNEKQGWNQGCEVLSRNPIVFTMSDGYQIHGDYNLVPNSRKFCLLLHGHGTSREGALRYALLFYELGYSTIIYDERSHGDNVHKAVTLGYQESKDLLEIIPQVYQTFGKDIDLGLQGVSMGAATCLLALKSHHKVSYVVSDSSFSKLEEVVCYMLKNRHLIRWPIVPLTNLFLKQFHHFSFQDCAPIMAVKVAEVPILFIQGTQDSFVPFKEAQDLFNATEDPRKKLYSFAAPHGMSLSADPVPYRKILKDFLSEKEGTVHDRT
jgi:alpha-beta hydrolase superfamily lysophospholipase